MNKPSAILALVSFVTLGCQSSPPVKSADTGSFMNLWNTYAHCQTESQWEQLKQDAEILRAAAHGPLSSDSFVMPLPGQIERMVTSPSARFAVDLKAMAASCSLRAGQAAVDKGKFDVARPLLESILEYHPQADYAYYSTQAKSMLLELDSVPVKVTQRPS